MIPVYPYRNHRFLTCQDICSFWLSLPPPSLSSNSFMGLLSWQQENHLLDATGCTSLLAFQKITEHAVGQMPVCFACLCRWFIKSHPHRLIEFQEVEEPEKTSHPTPGSPTHPPLLDSLSVFRAFRYQLLFLPALVSLFWVVWNLQVKPYGASALFPGHHPKGSLAPCIYQSLTWVQ